jgi:ATP-dependent RNA helicase DDX3X
MRKLAKKYLGNDHIRIRIGRAGSTHANVKQNVVTAPHLPLVQRH